MNDFTDFTGDRWQTNKQTNRRTSLSHKALGLRIGPACEAGLSACMERERVPAQRRKKERKKDDRQLNGQTEGRHYHIKPLLWEWGLVVNVARLCSETECLSGADEKHTRRKLCRDDDDDDCNRVGLQRWTVHRSPALSFMYDLHHLY